MSQCSEHIIPAGVRMIWFDLDDTLYDFSASSLIALHHVYATHSLATIFGTEERWVDIYHRHNAALWQLYNAGGVTQEVLRRERFARTLAEGGYTDSDIDSMAVQLDADYLDALAAAGIAVEGAREVLGELRRRGYKIGVLSNGFQGIQQHKLDTAGLLPMVDCIVLSDEAGINKPDPGLYDYALRKAGVTAAESVMVGDNISTDIAGAQAAGWHWILFDRASTAKCADPNARVISRLIQLVR